VLTVVTWRWGRKYSPDYVARLQAAVARNLSLPHRFLCICDDPADLATETAPIRDTELLSVLDGCYARLRMFDPRWQAEHRIERLVCLDLDMVITGPLDPLFDRAEPFVILHGGHYNPCPFNGSVMMIRAGARSELWTGFTVEEAVRIAHADGQYRGSDQTWIAAKAPDAAGWTHRDGIYGFRKPGWPWWAKQLPRDARIVSFPGKRDPSKFSDLDWVSRHWRA